MLTSTSLPSYNRRIKIHFYIDIFTAISKFLCLQYLLNVLTKDSTIFLENNRYMPALNHFDCQTPLLSPFGTISISVTNF